MRSTAVEHGEGAPGVNALQQAGADVDEQGTQVFKGLPRVSGNITQHFFESSPRKAGGAGRFGHGGHLRIEKVRGTRAPGSGEQTPQHIQVEGAGDGLACKKCVSRRCCALSDQGTAGEMVPGNMGHDVGGNVFIGQHISALAAPKSEIQQQRPIPARNLAHGQNAKLIARIDEDRLELGIQRHRRQRCFVVDGEFMKSAYAQGRHRRTVAHATPESPCYRPPMKYLHSMIRVLDLDAAVDFFVNALGLVETRRQEHERGRFTLVFLATEPGAPEVELTCNWDQTEPYSGGRNFGHLAYAVDDIYATCQRLQDRGVVIVRPPRDGRMAFVRSPDQISIELLQAGPALEIKEPWASMPSQGEW